MQRGKSPPEGVLGPLGSCGELFLGRCRLPVGRPGPSILLYWASFIDDRSTGLYSRGMTEALVQEPDSIFQADLAVPAVIRTAPGIFVQGRRIRSLVFSTDLAVICHCNADAVLAVYPFTCQPAITQALVAASQRPVFNGVGGSITHGERCVEVALHSEMQGVAAVVVNTSIPIGTVEALLSRVNVPVVVTVCADDEVAARQIEAGATMVNVAAGIRTAEVVAALRGRYPSLPIIATGGRSDEAIVRTIAAGADAISWTPPDIRELERAVMEKARALAAAQVRA